MWFTGVELEQETSAPRPKEKTWIRPWGSLRYLDGDGNENVTQKLNSRSFNRYRDYSNSFTLSNASELFLSQFPKKTYSSSERERKFSCRLVTSSIKLEIRHLPVAVVQWRQRNVQKSVVHVQSCSFAYSTYRFFLPFSYSSLTWHLKVTWLDGFWNSG